MNQPFKDLSTVDFGTPRPKSLGGTVVTTPETAAMVQLLGLEATFQGVGFTRDQMKALKKAYGFTDQYYADQVELARADHEAFEKKRKEAYEEREKSSYGYVPPFKANPFRGENIRTLHAAGSDRNLFRYMERDGLRLVAFLARLLEPGEDPVQFLEEVLSNAGFDVMLSDWPEEREPRSIT